ncbi:MAG: hypothetical protein QOJ02_3118 [Acidobacteriota bacterium]|jgi:hypothetical protein|nr:hypothetical protein [Acidobacteriota bacterium]
MQKPYQSPQIHDLGEVAKLTEGSYPHDPEKNGTHNSRSVPSRKAAKRDAKKTAPRATREK